MEDQTQLSEIEQKFMKKKNPRHQWMNKLYKEDDDLAENYLENHFADREVTGNTMKTKKEDIRQL